MDYTLGIRFNKCQISLKRRPPAYVVAAFRPGGGRGSGGGRKRMSGAEKPRDLVPMNEAIRADELRVIGEDKEPLGVMSKREALDLASENGVDLILVVPDASPPVCRLIEYSKFNYEKTKAEKDAKKKQRESVIETKELKMRPGTDVHDYQVKVRAAQKFIDKGLRVKLTLQFRGREMEFKEIGRAMFDRFVEDLGGVDEISVEQAAKMQGRQMNMILGPKKEQV
jgi:translation initiation factor IF-3